ncbi:MAG: transcriptional regulator GlxA family with amidase domain, partial [Halieaceae bacterium]
MSDTQTERSSQGNTSHPTLVGFLLLKNYTMISLATAVEPLRMANELAGKELYAWLLV